MEDEKHESKRNCHPRQKWLPVAAILLLVLLIAGFSVQYISFVSQTIYQESTSHLEEVLHKSNNMLKEMVRKNLTYLHLYNGFLESTSDEAEIQAYIRAAQQEAGFAEFYFLTYDGNYMTVTGKTGYLGLQTNLDEKLSDGEDIVVNTALPGKAPMLAFICPETQGSYRGFAYDAVAITYYNDAVLRLLDSSAFQGNASNYVIYPDGRVVIDNSVNRKEIIYNFIAMLRDHSDLSEEQILALSDDFAQGRSGNLRVKLGDTSYYLVYEDTAVQNWTMVGLVPVSIVNANLDMLWFRTAQIVAGVAAGLALLIILLERTRMIGVLKTLGMGNGALQKMFVIRSSFIILRGMVWGNLIGIGLCLLQYFTGWITLDEQGYFLTTLPVSIRWGWVLMLNAGTFVLIVALLSLPTMLISFILPERSIRFE